MHPALRRAERLAATISSGSEILAFLRQPEISEQMIAAAERGKPSVGAVADELRHRFPELMEQPAVRQAVGLLIAGAMAELGYSVVRTAVRINDPQFQRAAVYGKVPNAPQLADSAAASDPTSLALRIAETLTRSEAEALLDVLAKKFPDLLE